MTPHPASDAPAAPAGTTEAAIPTIAADQVLATLNADGSRRWIQPKPSHGRYWRRRLVVAWGLVALFVGLPFLRVGTADGGSKPAFLLDIVRREFTLFGKTLLPTDSVLLMLFLLAVFLGVFLLTALYGRVWCGWGCPQTVYMEFLFRPIERWLDRARWLGPRRAPHEAIDGVDLRTVVKYAVFALLAAVLGNVFLAWFVGVDRLGHWMTASPLEHPTGFAVMVVTAALVFVDFAWFREQMCMVACPYARLQSALLDRRSLVVGYDAGRGEPRGKLQRKRAQDLLLARTARTDAAAAAATAATTAAAAATVDAARRGDCVDCGACARTCPMGIDVRDGLQMECIACTQCIDACDAVMLKVGKPVGLIRYTSQDELEGRPTRKWLRPRTILYPLALVLVIGLFVGALRARGAAELTVLRGIGAPFSVQADGTVVNQLRVKILSLSDTPRAWRISLVDAPGIELIAPENPLRVPAGRTIQTSVFAVARPEALIGGGRTVTVRVDDGQGPPLQASFRLLGPTRTGGAR